MNTTRTSPPPSVAVAELAQPVTLQFENNALLARLVGDHDRHLRCLEEGLEVDVARRGNRISIRGLPETTSLARITLSLLYQKLAAGETIDISAVEAAIRMSKVHESRPTLPLSVAPATPVANYDSALPVIRLRHGNIEPRSPGQAEYMRALASRELVFGIGPAGTGKTYLAVAQAVSLLLAGSIDRIILSRPAVEAGERLGFLPGDMKDKIDPYLRPLYDALHDMLPGDQVMRRMSAGEIEVAPLAFMRGRTLSHAFVILDEAQNTTIAQMKMFLTRLGPGSRMVVTGDLTQIDLPYDTPSGLQDAVNTLENVKGITISRFEAADVVRHKLVARIIEAYDAKTTTADKKGHSRHKGRQENNGTAK
ncbi:PhoH family protein [Acetobacter syzygii]|uniref:PhoH-like protein n=1 Tax=Acetobacter syzygii TaxID=146476 RepID=A0A270BTL1_9PROT|nr:phosphate starvation-inducible protein PhoH [Acetobacter syzygii]PAL28737.1 phosphate starvation-inducible protein PhoH [Acetobacter syzygii]GAN71265.1 phosphate starvation-inducible protein PhoH [Acetobacter syzygii]GBR63461.1 phosphate starvation-inducible protein PhoH [Acetobacter syzygii NRIC 0483]GEL55147.1 phosphate starvation protein PhoH [Acetobacter syzygii]